jgi:hypothetical protein
MSEHLANREDQIRGIGVVGMIALANAKVAETYPIDFNSISVIDSQPELVAAAAREQLSLLNGFAEYYPEETWNDHLMPEDARIKFEEFAAARNRGE